MAIGPVQLIVLGFSHPNFHGEVIAELSGSGKMTRCGSSIRWPCTKTPKGRSA